MTDRKLRAARDGETVGEINRHRSCTISQGKRVWAAESQTGSQEPDKDD